MTTGRINQIATSRPQLRRVACGQQLLTREFATNVYFCNLKCCFACAKSTVLISPLAYPAAYNYTKQWNCFTRTFRLEAHCKQLRFW